MQRRLKAGIALAQADRLDPALRATFIDPVGEIELPDEPEDSFDPDAPHQGHVLRPTIGRGLGGLRSARG